MASARHRAIIRGILASALLLTACAERTLDLPGDEIDIIGSDLVFFDHDDDDAAIRSVIGSSARPASVNRRVPEVTGHVPVPEFIPGPLDDFRARIMGRPHNMSAAEEMAELEHSILARQQHIAECMHAQGFEFVPGLWNINLQVNDYSALTVPFESREFAEIYGFGMTTDPWHNASIRVTDIGPNPNDAITARMSTAERTAYDLALNGPGTGEGEFWISSADLPTVMGCWGSALVTVGEPGPPGFHDWLDIEWGMGASRAIDFDPRLTSLNASWVACMMDVGESGFNNRSEMTFLLAHERSAVLASGNLDQLRALPEWEIRMAVADWDCRYAVDFDRKSRAIEIDHQQRFVDRYFAELESAAQYAEANRVG
ncbi:MAG: hypothetical protein FWG25_03625 [Promicromonosporaceae bacterium]|nr:hypothetical protein [Promicromonosporaceae bacterium]